MVVGSGLPIVPAAQVCQESAHFWRRRILPSLDQLLGADTNQQRPLNYDSAAAYLDSHFCLLREDCLQALRECIQAFRCKGEQSISDFCDRHTDVRIFYNARFLAQPRCGADGMEHVVSFDVSAKSASFAWDNSKPPLMKCSLLCISKDGFATCFWALAGHNTAGTFSEGRMHIQVQETESDHGGSAAPPFPTTSFAQLDPEDVYVIMEPSSAYFGAYLYALQCLQGPDVPRSIFMKYFVHLQGKVDPPAYLTKRAAGSIYRFGKTFPELVKEAGAGTTSLDIMQTPWPEWANCALDYSQKTALHHALSRELALIQGPPGTGKTFLGLLIVQCLLTNLKENLTQSQLFQLRFERDPSPPGRTTRNPVDSVQGPILVVCYTNHALDQFLMGILQFEENVVRIGNGSKEEELNFRNLSRMVQQARDQRGLERSLHHESRDAYGAVKRARSAIRVAREKSTPGYVPEDPLRYVTEEALQSIASEEQRSSLFSSKGDVMGEGAVRKWLEGHASCSEPDPVTEPVLPQPELSSPAQEDLSEFLHFDAESIDSDIEYDEDFQITCQEKNWHEEREVVQDEAGQVEASTEHGRRSSHDVSKLQLVEIHGDHNEGPENLAPQGDDEKSMEDVINTHDVWILSPGQRHLLHQHWLTEINKLGKYQARTMDDLYRDYEAACKHKEEVCRDIQISLLREARVVGMTTTAAARLHGMLVKLKPEIIIVEEAAEVLESHILACLTPYTQQLILIGDHMQLRPSVAVHRPAMENKLNVSLFERMVTSGVEYVSLAVQRRMRPSISRLITPLYPNLVDHPSVKDFPDVTGVKHSTFFLDHRAQESCDKETINCSKMNKEEALLIVEFCVYLLSQGCYSANNIVILSMYSRQVHEITRLLQLRLLTSKTESPLVRTVDDYQGEESDILILSLVRNNQDGGGTIGFLKSDNRVCVALSRARIGLYLFGNAELLAKGSDLWRKIISTLEETGEVGSELTLVCQNHSSWETNISKSEDFTKVSEGGCDQPCQFTFKCGHVCPRKCHAASHAAGCPRVCAETRKSCGHKCTELCHAPESCQPCTEKVEKVLPSCGHSQVVLCSEPVENIKCMERCPRLLGCSHACPQLCGELCSTRSCGQLVVKSFNCGHSIELECSTALVGISCQEKCSKTSSCGHPCNSECGSMCPEACQEIVRRDLPCGHSADLPCSTDPTKYACPVPCGAVLSSCNHICQGMCGECHEKGSHATCLDQCGRVLGCGHTCEAECSSICPPCPQKCLNGCFHASCPSKCADKCQPCEKPCTWRCRHFQCELLCHQVCTRPRCNRRCSRQLEKCKHRCPGLCGEPCPSTCRICDGETMDTLLKVGFKDLDKQDRLIMLIDCKHVFAVRGLDSWMDLGPSHDQEAETKATLSLKVCPTCKTPVRRAHRYGDVVKPMLAKVEEQKRHRTALRLMESGNKSMRKRQRQSSIYKYLRAVQAKPELLEAHLALGRAYSSFQAKSDKAVFHLRIVVEHSTFRSHPGVASALEVPHPEEVYATLPSCNIRPQSGASTPGADKKLAEQALLEWARILDRLGDSDRACQLCEAVVDFNPEHIQAATFLQKFATGDRNTQAALECLHDQDSELSC